MRQILIALFALAIAPFAHTQAPWPDDAPDQWVMAHVDVETTGLNPAHHEMIDIGLIYTDLAGAELGRLHVRIMPDHPERIDEGARRVNGFDVEYWRAHGAVNETQAVRQIVEFHHRMRAGKRVIFTAFNVGFDQSFTRALFAQHGVNWNDLYFYHILDIPSMAWGQGLTALNSTELSRDLGIADETRVPIEHTGITGAAFNVSVYRALLARRAH